MLAPKQWVSKGVRFPPSYMLMRLSGEKQDGNTRPKWLLDVLTLLQADRGRDVIVTVGQQAHG